MTLAGFFKNSKKVGRRGPADVLNATVGRAKKLIREGLVSEIRAKKASPLAAPRGHRLSKKEEPPPSARLAADMRF
jgi:hypothetical protein